VVRVLPELDWNSLETEAVDSAAHEPADLKIFGALHEKLGGFRVSLVLCFGGQICA
jgi:hypothetical protein